MSGFVQSHLKDMNRMQVYRLLSLVRETSKADISRRTGISETTVIKIINFFLDTGLVSESGDGKSVMGRKPQLLRFNPDTAYAVGVYLEGHFLNIGLVNLIGEVIHHKKVVIEDLNIEHMVKRDIAVNIEDAIVSSGVDRTKILAVGVGIPPAVLDNKDKKIWLAPVIELDEPISLKEDFDYLEKRFQIPFYIENDVNVAAVGEFLSWKHIINDMAYISLGTGLGMGIILNGKIRRGARGCAGEISRMVFDPDYIPEKKAYGWLEQKVNLKAVLLEYGMSIHDFKKGIISHFREVIDYITPVLALSIVNFAVPLDLDLVVLGGVFADILGQDLIDALNNKIKSLCPMGTDVYLQKSSDPGVVGAAMMAIDENLHKLLGEEGATWQAEQLG